MALPSTHPHSLLVFTVDMVGNLAASRLHSDYSKGKVTAGMVDLPLEPDAEIQAARLRLPLCASLLAAMEREKRTGFHGAESQPVELLRRIQKEEEDRISVGAKHSLSNRHTNSKRLHP